MPQMRAGNVKTYAVTAANRLAAAPDVPTVDEAGLPGFHVVSWHAIWAPKATPKDVIARLNAAVVAALADLTVRQRLCRRWSADFSARATDTGGGARLPCRRDCEVVADRQGGEHQGGVRRSNR